MNAFVDSEQEFQLLFDCLKINRDSYIEGSCVPEKRHAKHYEHAHGKKWGKKWGKKILIFVKKTEKKIEKNWKKNWKKLEKIELIWCTIYQNLNIITSIF